MNRFSCVVDDSPTFRLQSLIWLTTLLRTESATTDEIVLHLIRGMDKKYLQHLDSLNIEWLEVDPFGTGPAVYCNKLTQLQTSVFNDSQNVILCDTDIAFAENISERVGSNEGLSAKTIDLNLPDLRTIKKLLRLAKIRNKPSLVRPTFCPDEYTISGNCNGGIYLLQKTTFDIMKSNWVKWSKWLLGQEKLLGKRTKHADQLGFAFAALEDGLRVNELGIAFNFPTHLSADQLRPFEDTSPKVVHYHHRTDEEGCLNKPGIRVVDQAIDNINMMTRDLRKSWLSIIE